ncbi:MAG TPA: hypothetical protein VD908_06105 [Cytophagales bacterium]|nr:hypothetical protein [Cytophagales bacterium]
MKIPVIKKLVEIESNENLLKAEEALLNEESLEITVEGDDEGEQLTHIIAARWIQEKMKEDNMDFKAALREYTKKVRESIN